MPCASYSSPSLPAAPCFRAELVDRPIWPQVLCQIATASLAEALIPHTVGEGVNQELAGPVLDLIFRTEEDRLADELEREWSPRGSAADALV